MIIGPHCAGWFDPRAWGSTLEVQNTITLEVMRVVLATGLFAIGVELPKAYLAEHWKSLVAMVVPTMAFGWVICAGEFACMYANIMNGWVDSIQRSHLWSLSSTILYLGLGYIRMSHADRPHPCRRYHRWEVCYQECTWAYSSAA